MTRVHHLLLITALVCANAEHIREICSHVICICAPAIHPTWKTINCSVAKDKAFEVLEDSLPETTAELHVYGGEAVMVGTNSLSRLRDLRQLTVNSTGILLIRKNAAFAVNSINLSLEITNCVNVRIEERAFANLKGPLTVKINNCSHVSLAGEAFSWLLTMKIDQVRRLDLSPGAFMLDATAANFGQYGPGLTIYLSNLMAPDFPSQAFGSSAAEIALENVEVRAIRREAFSANTYSYFTATNSSFHLIEGEAFALRTLINEFRFFNCNIIEMNSKAIQSAIGELVFTNSSVKHIETGAINITVANVIFRLNEFTELNEKGFVFHSWNNIKMMGNYFVLMAPNAIWAPVSNAHGIRFAENSLEGVNQDSLKFIGDLHSVSPYKVVYKNNYFAETCNCNITNWVERVLHTEDGQSFINSTYCTVNELFSRCFNVPEQNMIAGKFTVEVCGNKTNIHCEPFKAKAIGTTSEIKNPRFPHINNDSGLSNRNAKVIAIIIISVGVCVIIALLFTVVYWLKRKEDCFKINNVLIHPSSPCASFCEKICGTGGGMDSAGSISQLSVQEYSERRRLNEPRTQETPADAVHETLVTSVAETDFISTDEKTTQTLPEELTKELLESLKKKLDDPDKYLEASEMIEHLYELTKIEENCNNMQPHKMTKENIYDLPFCNTAPRIGKNMKPMKSVGTKTPSLDKLLPISPYNRQTALLHDYFEPKDSAIHLYAEIANDKGKKYSRTKMPDLVGEQSRSSYRRGIKGLTNVITPAQAPVTPSYKSYNTATIKSNSSNSSAKMKNRPLPEKPLTKDPNEATIAKIG